MTKETLVLTAVHGDENFSIPVIERLAKEFSFDWLKANPDALGQNRRFLEADLNRSGPGDINSSIFEERLAFRLIQKGQKYKTVIDIHGTIADTGVFIILGDANWKNIELAKKFDIANVVLWPGLQQTGPLCQFIPNSLEIECGPMDSANTNQELTRTLTAFFNKEIPTTNQQYFIVTGKLIGVNPDGLKNFQETTINNNPFYPLLVGQYTEVSCYMMQKLGHDKIVYA